MESQVSLKEGGTGRFDYKTEEKRHCDDKAGRFDDALLPALKVDKGAMHGPRNAALEAGQTRRHRLSPRASPGISAPPTAWFLPAETDLGLRIQLQFISLIFPGLMQASLFLKMLAALQSTWREVYGFPLCNLTFFLSCCLDFLFLFGFQQFDNDLIRYSFLHIYPAWALLSFLYL